MCDREDSLVGTSICRWLSTLADANDAHDWRIYADFAQVLIAWTRFPGPPLSGSDAADSVNP
jgi:hypothetical protein